VEVWGLTNGERGSRLWICLPVRARVVAGEGRKWRVVDSWRGGEGERGRRGEGRVALVRLDPSAEAGRRAVCVRCGRGSTGGFGWCFPIGHGHWLRPAVAARDGRARRVRGLPAGCRPARGGPGFKWPGARGGSVPCARRGRGLFCGFGGAAAKNSVEAAAPFQVRDDGSRRGEPVMGGPAASLTVDR
jgi:hypothetical protein